MKLHSKLGSEKQKRETSHFWKEKQSLEGQKLNPLKRKYSQERVLRIMNKLQDENVHLKKTIDRLEKKIKIQSHGIRKPGPSPGTASKSELN